MHGTDLDIVRKMNRVIRIVHRMCNFCIRTIFSFSLINFAENGTFVFGYALDGWYCMD